jgi:hypothetical protein
MSGFLLDFGESAIFADLARPFEDSRNPCPDGPHGECCAEPETDAAGRAA